MAILRNDTTVRSADGQTTSAIVTAANIGSYGISTTSTYYIGTTQNVFNRSSASQTLTGVSIDGNAATASTATQFNGEANTNFLRGLANGTEANINTYTDNGFRLVSYTGHSKSLLSFTTGGSTGSIQQEYFYNTPANGWRVRNKTDSTTWSAWGNVVMTDTNQGALTGTVITTGNSSGLSPTFTNLYAGVFYDSANTAYYLDPAGTTVINALSLTTLNNMNAANGTWHTSAEGQARFYFSSSSHTYFRTGNLYIFRNSSDSGVFTIDGSGNIRTTSGGDNYASYSLHVGGSGYATADFRAPIFYDSGDTTYYLDPANTGTALLVAGTIAYKPSVGNNVVIGNDATYGTSGTGRYVGIGFGGLSNSANKIFAHNMGEDGLYICSATSRGIYFRANGGSTDHVAITSGGSMGIGTSSPSQKLHVVGNIIVAPASSSWAEGLSFTMPTASTWGGLRWRREVANNDGNHYVGYTGLDSTDDLVFGSNNGGTQINNNIRITKAGLVGIGTIPTQKFHVSGIAYSDTDFRAPIFYDSNDTAYYCDPNGTSRLANLRVYSSFDTASSDVYANMRVIRDAAYTDGLFIGYNNAGTGVTRIYGGGVITGELTKYSNYTLEPGSFRSPIFYDSDNTAYYIDPATTSNLYDLTLSGAHHIYLTINSGNNYEAMVRYIGGSGSSWYVGKRTSSQLVGTANFHFYSEAAGATVGGIDTSGNIYSTGSVRSPIFYDSDNTNYYTDPASTSVLNRLKIDGGNFAYDWYQSFSDFVNGTLITTDIPASAAEGESFVMEVVGKSYSTSTSPFNFSVQGYLYNSTIINYSGITLDSTGLSTIKIFENGGFLCFWWARVSYWNAFEVSVRAYNSVKSNYNRVTNITDVVEPTGTKKVTVTLQRFMRGDVSATNSVDLRAPIFYDSNDTNYYLDPASTSRLNTTRIGNINVGSGTYLNTITPIGDTNINLSAPSGAFYFDTFPRMPGLYDSDNTSYYVDPASTSNLNGLTVAGGNATIYRDLTVNGGTGGSYGNRIIVQGTATTYTLQDNAIRPTVYLTGAYPVVTLNHTVTNNANHGPTIQFAFNGLTTGGSTSRQIVIGANGTATYLDFGFSGGGSGTNSDYNPHNGISGYSGLTPMRLFSNGLLLGSTGTYPNHIISTSYALDVRGTGYSNTDFRAPIFYDSDNTSYYLNPASLSQLSAVYANDWFRAQGNTGLYFQDKGYGITSAAAASNSYGNASTYGTGLNSWQGWGIGSRHCLMSNGGDNIGIHDNTRSWLYYWDGTYHRFQYGYLESANSVRGPIFYDSDNTSYYANPAGTSVFNELTFGSNITIRKNNDRNLEVQGGGGTDSGITGKGSSGQFAYQLYGSGSGSYGFLDGVWAGWDIRKVVDGNLYLNDNNTYYLNPASDNYLYRVYGAADIRSPIFYDNNDTSYYCDPNGNSILNVLYPNSYCNLHNDYKDILVYGDVNTYYVVLIQGEYAFSYGRYSITRGYSWQGPDTWNTATHKGGLTLDFEWSGDVAWGGNDHAIRIIEFNETYSNMVAGFGYPVTGGVIVWLRGGGVNGAQYRIRTPIGGNNTVTVYDGVSATNHSTSTSFTAGDSTVYSTRANNSNITSEIYSRYPVRATGSLYNEGNGVVDTGGGNQTKSGYFASAASVRAPIFYDTDNTAFYVDGAGTSRLAEINIDQGYTYGWWRNWSSGNGIYNQSTGQHFYSDDVSYWNVASSSSSQGIRLRTGGHGGTVRGYFYADTNNDVGILNNSGNWRLRVVGGDYGLADGSSMRAQLFYDSNNTSYYLDPANTSNLYYIQMPYIGNGSANILVNNGGSENWKAIQISGGNDQNGIGYSNTSHSAFGRNNFSFHVHSSDAVRFHSSGWDTLFEVAGSTGNAWLKGGLFAEGFTRLVNPGGAYYVTSTSTVTGAIKIRLPRLKVNCMMRMTVKIYQYNTGQSATIECGGYDYAGDGIWRNIFAYQNSDIFGDVNVRFGNDGTYDCIWIGETSSTWSYPQVFVTDFQAGYNNYTSDWGTGWNISYVTSFNTVTDTRVAYKTLNTSNSLYVGTTSIALNRSSGSQTLTGVSIDGNSATVTINYGNNSNSTYQMLWGSGNSIYGTTEVYLNPSTDYVYAASFNATDWFRSTGNTGWYNGTYGGGIYMTDTTWVRVYNSKYFYCDTIIQAGSYMLSPIYYDANDTNYYLDPASTSNLSLVKTRNTFGQRIAVTASSPITIDTQYSLTQLTLTGSISSMSFSNIQADGIVHMWTIVTVGNATAYTITWPAAVKWPGGTAPTVTTTNTKRDIYQFVTYDGGTNIYAIIVGQNL